MERCHSDLAGAFFDNVMGRNPPLNPAAVKVLFFPSFAAFISTGWMCCGSTEVTDEEEEANIGMESDLVDEWGIAAREDEEVDDDDDDSESSDEGEFELTEAITGSASCSSLLLATGSACARVCSHAMRTNASRSFLNCCVMSAIRPSSGFGSASNNWMLDKTVDKFNAGRHAPWTYFRKNHE